MSRTITVAATQMPCDWNIAGNIDRAEGLVREAAAAGADVVLLQELFETPYFCIEQDPKHLALATSVDESETIARFSRLAAELQVVLPISWFERAGRVYYNSVAMLDADGSLLGVYRKSHIPNDVGYQEKQYFSPGDTGFRVWDTRHGKIGVGICWDQWFPEAARCMMLMGAELLLYPTAIGSEIEIEHDSMPHWRAAMAGHAAANIVPVVASNRVGTEVASNNDNQQLTFYGSSFVCDHMGQVVAQAGRDEQTLLTQRIDLDEVARMRDRWCLFRDRRPDLYGPIMTLDGQLRS